MVPLFNLYTVIDDTERFRRAVIHAGQLLDAGETDRLKGFCEGLAWFNRSAFDAIYRVYGQHLVNILRPAARDST